MPVIQTKYFATAEYEPGSVFHFPAGLPGFEEEHRFVFLERPDTDPLLFLQSVTNPDLCFLILPILAADPNYRLEFTPEDRRLLRLDAEQIPQIGKDILCGAVLSVGEESQPCPTVNLLAPIVVNLQEKVGLQIIQTESGYSHQHTLFPREEPAPCL